MQAVVTGPFMIAALVLCAAGVGKFRSPAGAVRAAIVLGLPARASAVRSLAGAELALGIWALLAPSPAVATGVGALYAAFCLISLTLARRRADCGCFGGGDGDAPASPIQSLLSAGLCLVALLAALAPAHGIGWILGAAPAHAAVLMIGIVGASYAVVLVYTQLPRAWSAWSAR